MIAKPALKTDSESLPNSFERNPFSNSGDHAIEMLEGATTLTRLFTLISPHEMTEDPLFHETELGPVDRNFSATITRACDGNDWVDFLDTTVALTNAGVVAWEGVKAHKADVAHAAGLDWDAIGAALKREGRLHLETY